MFYFRDQLKMEKKKTIDLRRLIASKNEKLLRWMPGFVLRYLERVIHQDEINTFLEKAGELKDAEFSDAVMAEFKIKISSSGLENIPKTGPLIIVLNHPLGGMDALALISLLKNHRPDLRFIVNDILMNLENLSGLFVGINKHGINKKNVREDIEKAFNSEHEDDYNKRVNECIDALTFEGRSFYIIDKGREKIEKSVVWIYFRLN